MNPDAALLWASLAVPVLLRLMRLRPLTQTQARQVLDTSMLSESAEGRSGERFLTEAADVVAALEHGSTDGHQLSHKLLDGGNHLEVPRSHRIRLATALTQQVISRW